MLRNDASHFGLISRLIHWTMAVLILSLLVLGTYLKTMHPAFANLWLFSLHKSLGLTALALVVLRLVWHRISPPPAPIGPPRAGDVWLARAAHLVIYALLVLIPLTGWIYASATGLDILFANRWVIPSIAPVSEAWENAFHAAHSVLTKVLMAALTLHVLGALRRAFLGDGTLWRMIGG